VTASVAMATEVSGDPVVRITALFERGMSINTCWSALGSLSWHFDILVSILS
jgi:hypothetical protein